MVSTCALQVLSSKTRQTTPVPAPESRASMCTSVECAGNRQCPGTSGTSENSRSGGSSVKLQDQNDLRTHLRCLASLFLRSSPRLYLMILVPSTSGQECKAAGTRMEWDALWVYTPAPPAEAQMLRLEFSVGGELTGEYCEFSLSNPISADG